MVKSKADKNVTLIAVNTSVEGNIQFSGELYVNGAVVGDIEGRKESRGALVVSEEGSVQGEIRVPDIVIEGKVEGDIHAESRLELGRNARVRGDVHYKLVEIHTGAIVDGRMVPEEQAAENVLALPVGGRGDDG